MSIRMDLLSQKRSDNRIDQLHREVAGANLSNIQYKAFLR